eukprot:1487698-Pyramimonas_sp.AAC.1
MQLWKLPARSRSWSSAGCVDAQRIDPPPRNLGPASDSSSHCNQRASLQVVASQERTDEDRHPA